jgi:hypothetical protein
MFVTGTGARSISDTVMGGEPPAYELANHIIGSTI